MTLGSSAARQHTTPNRDSFERFIRVWIVVAASITALFAAAVALVFVDR